MEHEICPRCGSETSYAFPLFERAFLRRIYKDRNLTNREKVVASGIWSFVMCSEESYSSYPTIGAIGREIGIDRKAMRIATRKLEQLGFFKRHYPKTNRVVFEFLYDEPTRDDMLCMDCANAESEERAA